MKWYSSNEEMKEREFQTIYEEYYETVYMTVHNVLKERTLVHDGIQETFIKIYRHLEKIKGLENKKAWIVTISKNTALDLYRKQKKRNEYNVEDVYIRNEEGNGSHIEENHEIEEENRWFMEKMKKLKKEDREIIELKYFQGLSEKEIAKAMDIKEGTVKSRLYRAKEKLKNLLDEGSG